MIERNGIDAFSVFPATAGTVGPPRPIDALSKSVRVTLSGDTFSVTALISNAQSQTVAAHSFVPPLDSFEEFATVTAPSEPLSIPGPVRFVLLRVNSGVVTAARIEESQVDAYSATIKGAATRAEAAMAALIDGAAGLDALAAAQAASLVQLNQTIANAEQTRADVNALLKLELRGNLSAITGTDGFYKAIDTGYVYQRTGGVNTRRPNMEALSPTGLSTQFDEVLPSVTPTVTNEANSIPNVQTTFQVMKRVTTRLQATEYAWGQVLALPQGRHIEGAGGASTIIHMAASANGVQVDGLNGTYISGLQFYRDVAAAGAAVYITGAARNITVEDVWAEGHGAVVMVQGQLGTTPGTARNITLRNVRNRRGVAQGYGILVDNADTLDIYNMDIQGAGFDGVKLRAKARNVTLHGGSSTYNSDDGLDGYAGTQNLTVLGSVFEYNGAKGLYLKTGELNTAAEGKADTYGIAAGANLYGVRCNFNTGNGLDINRNSADGLTETVGGVVSGNIPLMASINVHGGTFSNNGGYGQYFRGRGIRTFGTVVEDNGIHGVNITSSAHDIELHGPIIRGNGRNTPGAGYGISISGQRIRVIGGEINGISDPTIAQISDETGKTKYHANSIRISAGADDVQISAETRLLNNVATDVLIDAGFTNERLIVNRVEKGVLPEGARYAGPGSTFIRSDGGNGKVAWIKESGYGVTGWVRAKPLRVLNEYALTGAVNVPANSDLDYDMPLTSAQVGLNNGGQLNVTPDTALPAGLAIVGAWVKATHSITIRLRNNTGASVSLPLGYLFHLEFRSSQGAQ